MRPEPRPATPGAGPPPVSAARPGGPDGSAGPDRAAHRDVIHDIGYRHYDGPRLGRSAARRALFAQSLRGAFGLGRSARSKVLPMTLLAVMCLPACLMVAVTVFGHLTKLPVAYGSYAIYLQAVIGLFLAAQAPQAVSRDLRFGTMPLYLSRPAPRADYVTAKFAALSAAVLILTGVPLLILYVGALLAKLSLLHQSAGFGRGLVSVALLSLLFAGIGLVIAAFTPRRGFGVAAVIAVFTLSYGAVSIIQVPVALRAEDATARWLGLFSPTTLVDGVQAALLGGTTSFPRGIQPTVAQGFVYLAVLLALVAGSYLLLLRRYRKAGL